MAAQTFCSFLRKKRKAVALTQTSLAGAINKTGMYICNLEKGKNLSPPNRQDLDLLADALQLIDDERCLFLELAAADRKTLPAEQIEYISNNPALKTLIRIGQLQQVSNTRWEQILKDFSEGNKHGK